MDTVVLLDCPISESIREDIREKCGSMPYLVIDDSKEDMYKILNLDWIKHLILYKYAPPLSFISQCNSRNIRIIFIT
jgi:hypothetical protein